MQLCNEFTDKVVFADYNKQQEENIHEQKLQHVSDFTQDALEILRNGEQVYGDTMPWHKTEDKIRFRPAEVTIWAGQNGSGKSLLMGQCAIHLSKFTKVGLASFEMPPKQTVKRMLIQAIGSNPSDYLVQEFNKQLDMYIYNHIGSLNQETVFGMCRYMAKEKGIKHIMIDSLVKCGVNQSENEKQKFFMSKIQDIAKEYDIHIHIVMHLKKSEKETDIPDKYSVKGAGELVDLTDNLFLLWRDKKKENEKDKDPDYKSDMPDCYLRVAKQRHGNYEKTMGFWWNNNVQQWVDNSRGEYHRYI